MSLHLYWNVASQPARSVKCLLNLGKIQHISHVMNMGKDQTRTKEYLLMNVLGQIPFIVDDGFKLAQSNAILVYLCQKYPEQLGKYYGKTLEARGMVNQNLSWYQNQFRPALFKIMFLRNYQGLKKKKPVYQLDLDVAQKDMYIAMGELENQFQRRKTSFVTGSEMTIADLQYFFEITNFTYYGMEFRQFTRINQWFQRMLQVQEVKAIYNDWLMVVPLVIKALNRVKVTESKL